MTATLAVTGSNICGDAAFSAALDLRGEVTVMSVPLGERGDLAQLCEELCAARGVSPADLRRMVIDVGPGSYTGLRVAVTFARVLQRYSDLKVEAVCSLAALARLGAEDVAAPVRTLLDARRGRWHTALHQHVGGQTRELEPARAAPVDAVLEALDPGEVLVAPAALTAQLQEQRGISCLAARGWSANALLAGGLPRFPANWRDLEPRYLMASYAED